MQAGKRRLSVKHAATRLASLVVTPLFACSVALSPVQAGANSNLPTMGDMSQLSMNPAQEYRLGQDILANLRLQLPLIEDPVITQYINDLGSRLVAATDNSHFPFTFLVVKDPSINAFAAPGGIVVVHSGLLDAADNESELAAVLAHEISHVTQRHIIRFYDKSGQANIAALVGIVAAVLLSAYSPAAAQAGLFAGMAVGSSNQLKFSRDNEKEADRHGREILSEAGFNTASMGTFFKKLQSASLADPGKVSEFLQTHPLPASRISDAWLPNQTTTGETDSTLFHYIKARVDVLTDKSASPETTTTSADSIYASHYAKAVEHLENRQPEKARKELDRIGPQQGKLSLLVNLLRAETYLVENAPEKAILILKPLVHTHPDHPAVIADLSSAYMDNHQPEKAFDLLRYVDGKTETFLPLLKLKADAASQLEKPVASHEALATWYERRGQLTLALEQIRIAQQGSSQSRIASTRLEAREQDLRDKLKQKQDQR
ncbi:MAG: M48 family metalloprotease [bacterium]